MMEVQHNVQYDPQYSTHLIQLFGGEYHGDRETHQRNDYFLTVNSDKFLEGGVLRKIFDSIVGGVAFKASALGFIVGDEKDVEDYGGCDEELSQEYLDVHLLNIYILIYMKHQNP